jgi:glutathione transport system ATP-binding protein
VAGLANRVLVMYAGRPVELGSTAETFTKPRMPYTAGLLGSIPTLDSQGGRLRPIPGAPPSLINLPSGCPFSPRCPLVIERCHTEEPELTETDLHDHSAACHRWDVMAEQTDATKIFRAEVLPG